MGSSCLCGTHVAEGVPVGQFTETDTVAVVPANVSTPVGHSTDTDPVTAEAAFVPAATSRKRLTAFVPATASLLRLIAFEPEGV
jgi:hypothetical protein